jgi:hypothetical protein
MENIKDYILHLVPTRRLAMPLWLLSTPRIF